MKKSVLILIFILLFISSLTFAETITLKSGKTIEGKIVEKTDKYIKVDIGVGMPITYFLDEIENIGGANSILSSAETMLEQNNQRQLVLDFLQEVIFLDKDLKEKLDATKKLSDEAKRQGERGKANEITLEEINIIRQTMEQIKELSAPRDCEKFKELTIKYYENLIAAEGGILEVESEGIGKFRDAWSLSKELLESSNECVAERKRIMQKYNIEKVE